MDDDDVLLLGRDGPWWRLRCDSDAGLVGQANDYLGYLADRNYSPRTVRTYGYGLLAFHRWLHHTRLRVGDVVTDDVLGFLTACRQERIPGRPGPNIVDLAGRPTSSGRRRCTCCWPRSRGCLSSWRCGIPERGPRSRRVNPRLGSLPGNAPARSPISVDDQHPDPGYGYRRRRQSRLGRLTTQRQT